MVIKDQATTKAKSTHLVFPSWKSVLLETLLSEDTSDGKTKLTSEQTNSTINFLDFVEESLCNKSTEDLLQLFANNALKAEIDDSLSNQIEKFKNICIAKNQFYTLYDIGKAEYCEVDQSIFKALGILPEQFELKSMLGLNKEVPLYHPDDLNHMIRWASLAYFIFDLPLFDWKTSDIYYNVSFRVGTSMSSSARLKKSGFVTLEKRCYPMVGIDSTGKQKPILHFDQWSVLDASLFEYVKPRWDISSDHTDFINELFYLFNAYLLNIPVKYLLMLNEKTKLDRNKAVAKSINDQFLAFAKLEVDFDEIQIGNAMAKSIRQKVEATYNLWDKRNFRNLIRITSDQEAIHFCKALGLLPIPHGLISRLYKAISI